MAQLFTEMKLRVHEVNLSKFLQTPNQLKDSKGFTQECPCFNMKMSL